MGADREFTPRPGFPGPDVATAPLGRAELDRMRCPCGLPACESPVAISGRCHPKAALSAGYFDGRLVLTCSVCNQVVAVIAVGDSAVGRR